MSQQKTKKITLNIGGMSCINCAHTIEKQLSKLNGVTQATVNLAAEQALIDYNPDLINKKTIQDSGYQVIEQQQKTHEDTADKERKRHIRHLKILLAASVALTIPILVLMWLSPLHMEQNNILMFLLATPVQFIVGWTFYVGTYKGLRNKTANMDTLIAMGTSTAWIYSTAVTFAPDVFPGAGVFFDTATMIMSFILLGKLLDAVAKGRTSEAIRKITGLQAKTARVIRNGEELEIPIEDVQVDDIVVVRPGEKIPVDGTVTEGYSAVDEK